VLVYFSNDGNANAVRNARTLRTLVAGQNPAARHTFPNLGQSGPSGSSASFRLAPSMARESLRIAAGRARPQAASSSWEVALLRRIMWRRSPIIPIVS
jgi:hypothetical protein